MNAQDLVNEIHNENIGSVIFRYSQARDSTVEGAGLSGVCEGMCYNFLRFYLFKPHTSSPLPTKLEEFRRKKAAGELAGGVFVKDESKASPVTLTGTEMSGERQASSGIRFSQAVRNLDAKFKKPLSEKAEEIITNSFDQDVYGKFPLSKYTQELQNIKSHLKVRDSSAKFVSDNEVTLSHLAPLLLRDSVREKVIGFGEIPTGQTSEARGQFLGEDLKDFINLEPPPDRVFAICDVSRQQSGHAIALDANNPNGPINVLDPNFGLIKYNTWDKLQLGFGKMWKLYQSTYDHYTLRRYSRA